MKNKLFLLGILSISLASCTTSQKMKNQVIDLDAVKNETIINLKVGEKVVIEAETNPSTGFSWNKEVPEDCSVQISNEETKAIYTDNRIGAPVKEITEITGEKAGTCTMSFEYKRSWESGSSTPKLITFIVK